jgi:ketosteroid isomerase-like protein
MLSQQQDRRKRRVTRVLWFGRLTKEASMRIGRTVRMTVRVAVASGLAVAFAAAETNDEFKEQVRKTEIAFAKTMADRDLAAFTKFLADDTIWLGRNVMRGSKQVADSWKRFYEGKEAPFSWEPERVEVNDSGTLGLSTGPVRDPAGKRVGTYNSIWRRGTDGKWTIIFDNGCPPCECPPARPAP